MGTVTQFELKSLLEYKDSVYSVAGKHKVGKDYHYKITCKVCSKKYPQIFNQHNPFLLKWDYSNRTSFNKETLKPCPCHKGYIWKEEDYLRRIGTYSESNLHLKSIGDFKGRLTLCKVYCDTHGGISTHAKSYLSGGGCKSCSISNTKLELEHKSEFERKFKDRLVGYDEWKGITSYYRIRCTCGKEYRTKGTRLLEGRTCKSCSNKGAKKVTKDRVGKFINNYHIRSVDTSSKTRDTKYIVECTACTTKDPELWYLGSCSSNWGNINGGQKCCGCSKTLAYKGRQVSILVKRLLQDTGYTLQSEVNTSLSKLKLELKCPLGHDYTSNYHNFLKGHRCNKCYLLQECEFGLYKDRLKEEDTLYLLQLDGFLKIGRSFNLTQRLRAYKQVFDSVQILTTHHALHKEVYRMEQDILLKFHKERYYHSVHFGGYSECINLNQKDQLLTEISKL